jgi:hypothetical protein
LQTGSHELFLLFLGVGGDPSGDEPHPGAKDSAKK